MVHHQPSTHPSIRQLAIASVLAVPVGILAGSASALFLRLLDWATVTRTSHSWLLYLLPLAGLLLGLVTHWLGRPVEKGNNLILEQIHQPGGGIPRRMAPLILGSTVFTHLFGGSAGREGTAVQMGGSLAATLARSLKLQGQEHRLLLMSGVAAGFGSVFGTPVAGAVFAIEVLTVGRLEWRALLPMLLAAEVGDMTCRFWHIQHTAYQISSVAAGWSPVFWSLLVGVACGLTAQLFTEISHKLHSLFGKLQWAPLRPAIGGMLIVALTWMLGTDSYLGLGVSSPDLSKVTILSAFHTGGAETWSWFWKLLLTALTLCSGFKGGEVTPLFFIGATLGNTLAVLTGGPVDLLAAFGLVALFAGAANTPVACTILAVELFGFKGVGFFAIACFAAFFCSGHSGIYGAQLIHWPSKGRITLAEARRSARRFLKSWRP